MVEVLVMISIALSKACFSCTLFSDPVFNESCDPVQLISYLYNWTQLADAKDVLAAIQNVEGASFPVLTPNLKVRIIVNGKKYCLI